MEQNYEMRIQENQAKVTATEISTFLQENSESIDNNVKSVVQKNYGFMERYVTKRGLVKLVDEIKTKQIKTVAQFYELIHKIECDGKLETASDLVQLRTNTLKLEFREQFRKFVEAKLVRLGEDVNNTRKLTNVQIRNAMEDLEKYKDIEFLYNQNLASVHKQISTNSKILDNHLEKFTEVITTETRKYQLN